HQHPFISCMVCGPRYTIIDRIPYDRDNTSMINFPMCDFCEGEYTDLHDRRYHAQTISCHECGPQLLWKGADSDSITNDSAILDRAAEILRTGGVLLFKSVGGYNLVADPLNDTAVSKLRRIKNREAKPFAVMFRNMDQIRDSCHVDAVEEKLLSSSARPILLLEHRLNEESELTRSRFIGSFLPSFAAQYMLLDRISPLIFTSANLSDMPMISDDNEAFEMMDKHPEIDGMIYNLRQIRVRVDDSVTRVIDGQPQMIRRSKGYAPVPLFVNTADSPSAERKTNADESTAPLQILAAGSQLKNSFALTKNNFVYMSQFFGDMDTIENQNIYEENIDRLKDLFRIRPNAVVCDMHPLYFTTQFSEKYAADNDLPLIKVQHHHAHVASVMAENDLNGKVIGVSFDGTGYGTDGNIWGGEFFLCEGADAERIAHLRYVDMIGGDSSVKDAVRSALSYIHAYDNTATSNGVDDPANNECHSIAFDLSDIIEYGRERLLAKPEAKLVMPALKAGINTVKSSSMGRLFDAVSALLGICDYNSYEGQCAILLEDAAAFAQKHPGERKECDLALSFHERIIDTIVEQCQIARDKYGAEQVALTGGTFQNRILMEGVLDKLRTDGFKPYYNISVSPNDGGIALGQSYIAMHSIKE
ncbi:MAG: carbamoyltransferase HypF, partial [Firmicutes bacterium]|nr:carbamoyltransferase HypF [Bacillota bacterium]